MTTRAFIAFALTRTALAVALAGRIQIEADGTA
jgi:hypothetical protein